ncbi:MAG: exodeoxyribonuclease VII small subunit [Clostridia bacterium]|nr:exodeoxyribonuclease VII small subunit [Clostridia bacterium]
MATVKKQSFQETMERLEEIVRLLEEGSRPLEESIDLYEEGQVLVKRCDETLKSARLKVEELGKEDSQ